MPRITSDLRWTWIFATIGLLVVVVVIGFLTGIVNALDSIDDGLKEADAAVVSVDGDARPLPDHVEDINANLAKIDGALKPISGQAGDILAALTSIDGSLQSVDGSLGNTAGSLSDTSGSLLSTSGTLRLVGGQLVAIAGSLRNTTSSLQSTSSSLRETSTSLKGTSSVLVRVSGLVRSINGRLIQAQRQDSQGTNQIPLNVARVNRVLVPVEADATAINLALNPINAHLNSICRANVLKTPLPGLVTPRAQC